MRIPHYDDERVAARYDKRPGTTRAELRSLRRLLADSPGGETILDVPCGRGRLAPFLRSLRPARLIGMDGSLAMLGAAGEGYDALIAADASALPLRRDEADVVVCMRLLHHFPASGDRVTILGEIARVARRLAVLSYYDARTLEGLRRRRKGRSARVGVRRSDLVRELGAAGLRPIRFASLLPLVREQTLVIAAPEMR